MTNVTSSRAGVGLPWIVVILFFVSGANQPLGANVTENRIQQREIAQSGLGGDDAHAMDEEILRKVIHIRSGSGSGTALTIEVDAKQYILTAAHLVDKIANATLEVQEGRDAWRPVRVAVVGMTDPALDIAVLAAEEQLTPVFDIRVGTSTVEFGQSVRMLGYPYNLDIGHLPSFRNSPLPMVRSGILSSFRIFDAHPKIVELQIDTRQPRLQRGPRDPATTKTRRRVGDRMDGSRSDHASGDGTTDCHKPFRNTGRHRRRGCRHRSRDQHRRSFSLDQGSSDRIWTSRAMTKG